jgi:ribosomal protein S18 acetylase RimI-like enzyme
MQDDAVEPGMLATDAVEARTLRETDLAAVIRVDQHSTGRRRDEYYTAKVQSALAEGKLQSSLVAELDGHVVGFVLARVYYGEFGRPEPVAVIDSIGVHPDFRGRQVGQALMRQLRLNLRALGADRLETQVHWTELPLLRFLAAQGFEPAPRLCLELDLRD